MNMPRTYPEGVTCWVDIEEADGRGGAVLQCAFRWTFLEPSRSSSLLDSTVRMRPESVN